MYQLVKAVLRSKTPFSGYTEVDLTGVTVNSIQATYRDGYLKLTNPSLSNPIYVMLRDIYKLSVVYPNIAFTAFLNNLSVSIPHTLTEPEIQSTELVNYDAMRHAQVELLPDLDKITISKVLGPGVDYNTHLVHVDGMFQIHEWDSQRRTIELKQNPTRPNRNDSIGLVKTVDDSPIRLYSLKDSTMFGDTLLIRLPDIVQNKVAVLFIGGYPAFKLKLNHFLGFFSIPLSQLNLGNIWLRMSRHQRIDEVQTSIPDPHVMESKIRSEAAYNRLKNDEGSFIAVFDGYDFLTLESIRLERTTLNSFACPVPPRGIVLDPYGFPANALFTASRGLMAKRFHVVVNNASNYSAYAHTTEVSDGTQILTEQTLPIDMIQTDISLNRIMLVKAI